MVTDVLLEGKWCLCLPMQGAMDFTSMGLKCRVFFVPSRKVGVFMGGLGAFESTILTQTFPRQKENRRKGKTT